MASIVASRVTTTSAHETSAAAAAAPSRGGVERLADALENIVSLVEARQDARAALLDAAAGGNVAPTFRADAKHVDTLGGPLTTTDLSNLSLLCVETSSSRIGGFGFDQVDPEMLLNLSTMLEAHVSSASSVDMIREVQKLLNKDGLFSDKSPATATHAVEQVRAGSRANKSECLIMLQYCLMPFSLHDY
jgi:hypothetical protein